MHDIAIIGSGPAGCTAALYCARFGRSVALFEKSVVGGQMSEAVSIENYPGLDSIDGFTLAQKMLAQAEHFGAQNIAEAITSVRLDAEEKSLCTVKGKSYSARSVIIATGAHARKLGLEKESDLAGRGISYCAACDGMLYRGKTVAVVGGGTSAVTEALHLSQICEKVHLLHRRRELRAPELYQEALRRRLNIVFHPASEVQELLADDRLRGILVKDLETGSVYSQTLDGLFIAIGREPETSLIQGQLATDGDGYIFTDESTQTAIAGVFAAGDVRVKPVRQITTAVSDGTLAAFAAENYLKQRTNS